MTRIPSPFDLMRLNMNAGIMLAEAQMVIALRLMGMAGMWRTSPGENARMLSEKLEAGIASGTAATKAVLSGKDLAAVAEAALKPVRRRTASNVRRLSRKGPRTPG